jgi:hypothetical protein
MEKQKETGKGETRVVRNCKHKEKLKKAAILREKKRKYKKCCMLKH